MAVRLQMKLGYAADSAHLPGSPDAILSEEPTIGSVVRSKGSLYLIVTARTGGAKVAEATRMVAEAIRDAYYYDESAGIVDCLEKATCYHGMYPHFMRGDTGATLPFSRKDDGADLVETAFLFQGLLCVRAYFDRDSQEEKRIRDRIGYLWSEAEWDW